DPGLQPGQHRFIRHGPDRDVAAHDCAKRGRDHVESADDRRGDCLSRAVDHRVGRNCLDRATNSDTTALIVGSARASRARFGALAETVWSRAVLDSNSFNQSSRWQGAIGPSRTGVCPRGRVRSPDLPALETRHILSSRRMSMKSQSGISLNNKAVAATPKHLLQFAVDQRYDDYTPVDHAVWRFIMRQNTFFLREYA